MTAEKFAVLNVPIRCRNAETVNGIVKAVYALHSYVRKREGIIYNVLDSGDATVMREVLIIMPR